MKDLSKMATSKKISFSKEMMFEWRQEGLGKSYPLKKTGKIYHQTGTANEDAQRQEGA